MIIQRDFYLDKLKSRRKSSSIKIITGIKGCGKSFLLRVLYAEYLVSLGIHPASIIVIDLEKEENFHLRDPLELAEYVTDLIKDKTSFYYVIIDEIQLVPTIRNPYSNEAEDKITFLDLLPGIMHEGNVDLYVIGSYSHLLSTEIPSQFRDRGYEIRVFPLSYAENVNALSDCSDAFAQYLTYGGLPKLFDLGTADDKREYLESSISETYLKDITERHRIYKSEPALKLLLRIIAENIGRPISHAEIAGACNRLNSTPIHSATVHRYLKLFMDSFLISEVRRYDVKRRWHRAYPCKYYFTDLGMANALLDFHDIDTSRLIENAVFNELVRRGYEVDNGVVDVWEKKDGKRVHRTLEIDFIARKPNVRKCFQVTDNVFTKEKHEQKALPLRHAGSFAQKIIIVRDRFPAYYDNEDNYIIGVEDFLLGKDPVAA